MAVALVAFDEDQVGGGEAGKDGGKVGFRAAVFAQKGEAVGGGEEDLGRAGGAVAEGVFAGLVKVDVVVDVLDGGDGEPARGEGGDEAFHQGGLAGVLPAHDAVEAAGGAEAGLGGGKVGGGVEVGEGGGVGEVDGAGGGEGGEVAQARRGAGGEEGGEGGGEGDGPEGAGRVVAPAGAGEGGGGREPGGKVGGQEGRVDGHGQHGIGPGGGGMGKAGEKARERPARGPVIGQDRQAEALKAMGIAVGRER